MRGRVRIKSTENFTGYFAVRTIKPCTEENRQIIEEKRENLTAKRREKRKRERKKGKETEKEEGTE